MTDAQRDWQQFALILIDVQRDFWSEEQAQNFPDFPANIARLLTFCRAEGIDIVHLRARFKADMSDWMPRYKLGGWIPCVEGTPGAEVLPFALDEPGETVILKQTFDGFQTPELLRHLEQWGKRFVLTAGLLTSVCVLLTTASAVQRGFLAAVVEDCCADGLVAHEHTLNRYPFVFERTTVDLIPERHEEWVIALRRLDQFEMVSPG